MPQVFMPRLSDTMTEGTVSTWTKAVGDRIEKGDVIAEIETDKATMELEAYDAGVLEQILVGVGTTVPIGEVIAMIGDGSGAAALAGAGNGTCSQPPPSRRRLLQPHLHPPPRRPVCYRTRRRHRDACTRCTGRRTRGPRRCAEREASSCLPLGPLDRTRRRSRLTTVTGSGPGGRIVRADVQHAIAALAGSGARAR